MATIDLRSDTVTRPTAGMRKAMAEAEVGDDVFDDDPTVHRLQDRNAELLATEVRAAFKTGDDPHLSLTRVVAIENTHNAAGGTCWDRARLAEVIDTAHG